LKTLVTGAGGMVGRAVVAHCRSIGDTVVALDHHALDIGNAEAVDATVNQNRPDIIINCAAWTNVDGCETDPQHAFSANASGPENLARASREINASFLTISTDYVFDGHKDGFYTQEDVPRPESIYGMSKLEGELRAQIAYDRSLIVRTGFIFGKGGTNFLSTVVKRRRAGEKLKAISDAYGTPTYATDLAIRLRELIDKNQPSVYHVVNSGEGVSYEEFARKALLLAGLPVNELESVKMETLPRPAPRPQNSRLKCLFSPRLGLKPLPDWSKALEHFVSAEAAEDAAEDAALAS